jgi:hypothetical protein
LRFIHFWTVQLNYVWKIFYGVHSHQGTSHCKKILMLRKKILKFRYIPLTFSIIQKILVIFSKNPKSPANPQKTSCIPIFPVLPGQNSTNLPKNPENSAKIPKFLQFWLFGWVQRIIKSKIQQRFLIFSNFFYGKNPIFAKKKTNSALCHLPCRLYAIFPFKWDASSFESLKELV